MNVVISAGGRFHAFHLANQLHKRNSLRQLYTFYYTKKDHNLVPPHLVKNIMPSKSIDFLATRLRLTKVINRSTFNVFQDNLFDYLVSTQLKKTNGIDIFVCWAHYLQHSYCRAKSAGAQVILESGSCHISEQQKLLCKEYKKWGLTFPPIHWKNQQKMVKEYELADYIMTLSEFSRQSFIRQGIPEKKLLKVPCGMDVEYFYNPSTEYKKKKKFQIIFVGLLSIRKGIHYLLQAWHQANLPEEETELILVGNIQKDLQSILSKLPIKDNVVFYGSTSKQKLKELYQNSSAFVLPSIEDGFGMVIGEAMASGLPVICSDHCAAPEIITDKKEGLIVPAGSAEKLAEKISWCFENQEKAYSMGQQGQKTIRNFTWDIYGQNVFDVYQNILNRRKPN